MKKLTHVSLFSGIGGLDLAAEWAGFVTVGQCEFADYPTKVLKKHWPDVPKWRDIRTLNKESFYEKTGLRTVDVISGGFPCQPFSVAGKRRGKDDDRYLWPEMLRVIEEIRPGWIVGENVAGIVNMALDTAIVDLEAQGYSVQTLVFPACAVGAPHRRDRCAIVGYAEHDGSSPAEIAGSLRKTGCKQQERENPACEPPGTGMRKHDENVADAAGIFPQQIVKNQRETSGKIYTLGSTGISRGTEDVPYSNWWTVEPDVGRMADGVPHRVDRLKCLGNAVVPHQFYPVFQCIADLEKEMQDK